MTRALIEAAMGGADPLAAAARFHAEILPNLLAALDDAESLVLRFDLAEEKPHRWRREAVAALARKAAPHRVNAVAPAHPDCKPADIEATIAYLHASGGLTGQLLIVD